MEDVNDQSVAWDSMIKEMAADLCDTRRKYVEFYDGPVFREMLSSFISIGGTIDDEEFRYNPAKTINRFGWQHLSRDDVERFIYVMYSTDPRFGEIEGYNVDEDCEFENYSFQKHGVSVSVLIGQGTSVVLTAKNNF